MGIFLVKGFPEDLPPLNKQKFNSLQCIVNCIKMEQKYRSAHNNIVAHALYSFACYSVKSESIFFGE